MSRDADARVAAAGGGGGTPRAGDAVPASERDALRASRRRLILDGSTIATYAVPVGLVYGFLSRQAGFSLLDAVATSVIVLAGGSQFVAVGMVTQGVAWPAIVGVTALVNARHLLYSAALAPFTAVRGRRERAAIAHFLTDESFALSLAHFRRLGRFDGRGYWLGAMLIFVPWTGGTALGWLLGSRIGDPSRLGLDVVFPAAMGGLAVGMISGRRDVVASCVAVGVAVGTSLVAGTAIGLVAGAVVGPFVGLAIPARPGEPEPGEAAPPPPRLEAGT